MSSIIPPDEINGDSDEDKGLEGEIDRSETDSEDEDDRRKQQKTINDSEKPAATSTSPGSRSKVGVSSSTSNSISNAKITTASTVVANTTTKTPTIPSSEAEELEVVGTKLEEDQVEALKGFREFISSTATNHENEKKFLESLSSIGKDVSVSTKSLDEDQLDEYMQLFESQYGKQDIGKKIMGAWEDAEATSRRAFVKEIHEIIVASAAKAKVDYGVVSPTMIKDAAAPPSSSIDDASGKNDQEKEEDIGFGIGPSSPAAVPTAADAAKDTTKLYADTTTPAMTAPLSGSSAAPSAATAAPVAAIIAAASNASLTATIVPTSPAPDPTATATRTPTSGAATASGSSGAANYASSASPSPTPPIISPASDEKLIKDAVATAAPTPSPIAAFISPTPTPSSATAPGATSITRPTGGSTLAPAAAALYHRTPTPFAYEENFVPVEIIERSMDQNPRISKENKDTLKKALDDIQKKNAYKYGVGAATDSKAGSEMSGQQVRFVSANKQDIEILSSGTQSPDAINAAALRIAASINKQIKSHEEEFSRLNTDVFGAYPNAGTTVMRKAPTPGSNAGGGGARSAQFEPMFIIHFDRLQYYMDELRSTFEPMSDADKKRYDSLAKEFRNAVTNSTDKNNNVSIRSGLWNQVKDSSRSLPERMQLFEQLTKELNERSAARKAEKERLDVEAKKAADHTQAVVAAAAAGAKLQQLGDDVPHEVAPGPAAGDAQAPAQPQPQPQPQAGMANANVVAGPAAAAPPPQAGPIMPGVGGVVADVNANAPGAPAHVAVVPAVNANAAPVVVPAPNQQPGVPVQNQQQQQNQLHQPPAMQHGYNMAQRRAGLGTRLAEMHNQLEANGQFQGTVADFDRKSDAIAKKIKEEYQAAIIDSNYNLNTHTLTTTFANPNANQPPHKIERSLVNGVPKLKLPNPPSDLMITIMLEKMSSDIMPLVMTKSCVKDNDTAEQRLVNLETSLRLLEASLLTPGGIIELHDNDKNAWDELRDIENPTPQEAALYQRFKDITTLARENGQVLQEFKKYVTDIETGGGSWEFGRTPFSQQLLNRIDNIPPPPDHLEFERL